jgi:serpin B
MGRRYSSHGAVAVAVVAGLCALTLVAVVSLSACGTEPAASTTSSPPAAATALSLPDRISATGTIDPGIAEVAASDNAFSLALFQAVRTSGENLVCSPYSAATILTLTMAGARGQTQEEMRQALRITLPYYKLHGAVNVLDQSLTAGGQFTSANGIWAQEGRVIKQPFANVAGHYYGATIDVYDMEGDYAGLCRIVNEWVSEKTGGRITDLMDPGDKPDVPYFLMMLVNAVHFKADWADPFWTGSGTQDRPFALLDGTNVNVPTMRNESSFRYTKTDELEAVELPFEGGRFAMTILMPAEDAFEDFAANTGGAALQDLVSGLDDGQVDLSMPRFEITSTPPMTDGLKKLGMEMPFTQVADFTGIADLVDNLPWYITDVEQKAFITVNERGAEAAAATGVTVAAAGSTTTAAPPVEIKIDHPFIYLIRDTRTGAIIFIGQVVDPRVAGAASPG